MCIRAFLHHIGMSFQKLDVHAGGSQEGEGCASDVLQWMPAAHHHTAHTRPYNPLQARCVPMAVTCFEVQVQRAALGRWARISQHLLFN